MAQTADILQGQVPLKGVVLCCTSLPQDVRTSLSDAAVQMGAVHKLDLTSDVTHLIVGSNNTPKYKYVAKERPDIKVLRPSWLEAVREAWMQGGDVDVEALQQRHRFPTFDGLQICVTGFENPAERTWMSETAGQHGATYHGDLTKAVTHLIAAAPQGDKYTHAKRWNISIVSRKWFEDSLRRGMAVDESFYDPTMPADEQGKGAFRRSVRPRTSLGKHRRDGESQPGGTERKKLRRTASVRLESQSQDMWCDMSAENAINPIVENNQWNDDDTTLGSEADIKLDNITVATVPRHLSAKPHGLVADTDGLFSGCHVVIHGFDDRTRDLLLKVLRQNQGTVVQSFAELEDASRTPLFKQRYLLVHHTAGTASFDSRDVPASTIFVTEWWVERCVHCKTLLDPEQDLLSQPLGDAHIAGMAEVQLSTTGFVSIDLRQVAEAVQLMGAVYKEKVMPSTTVLVSGSGSIKKEKAFYASRHRISVVSAEWIWSCLRSRKKLPYESYKIALPPFDLKDFTGQPSTNTPAASGDVHGNGPCCAIRKDDSQPKRLSSSRKKHATPSLSLHATRTPLPNASRRSKPIVHEDEDESVQSESAVSRKQTGSQPLQEISPNSSPHKAGPTFDGCGEGNSPHEKLASATIADPQPMNPELNNASHPGHGGKDLAANLAEILNRGVLSRPSSAASETPQKRKNRPLGRASSGISNRSISAPTLQLGDEEVSDVCSRKSHVTEPPPSTQLGYETLETQAHRLQMSKQMGTVLQDDADMRRVPSLGIVRDCTLNGDAGVGNRIKARGRAK